MIKIYNIDFSIWLPWNNTTYKPLMNYTIEPPQYDKIQHLYLWIFKLEDLNKVIGILGKPLETDKENEIMSLVNLCPPLKSKISTESWKGISGLQITKQEKVYQITEWRKDNNGTPKELYHEIPIENVIMAWEVIKKQELNEWVKTRKVCEEIYKLLGLQRYFRNTGTFDYEKAFGVRKDYFKYLYYPIKILEHYKVINYHKKGKIMKKMETFDTQVKL